MGEQPPDLPYLKKEGVVEKQKNRRCQTCGNLFNCLNATCKAKPCELWKECNYREKIHRCNKVIKFLPKGGVFSYTP